MKSVCFFGIYDPLYPRTRALAKGFEQNGWRVIECRVDPRAHRGFRKYLKLCTAARAIRKENPDLILVAFPGHTVVWLAKIVFSGTKIIFDMFLSLRDANLDDRGAYSRWGMRSLKDYLLDHSSSRLADIVLADTREQADFFIRSFGIAPRSCIPVYVGTDPDVFYPQTDPSTHHQMELFKVHFHGTFIPIHGTDTIIKAAELLRNEHVDFSLVGTGQTYDRDLRYIQQMNLSNVHLVPVRGHERMRAYIVQADVCLGLFGPSPRLDRVVANKIYEYAACRKPIITGSSTSVSAIFGEWVRTCPPGDAEALAREIRWLMNDRARARQLANGAYDVCMREYVPERIISRLIDELQIRGIVGA